MIAARHDLVLEQQTSFLKVFQWLDKANVGVDLTGYETELEFRDENDRIVDTYSTTNGKCTNSSAGKMTFSVGADETEAYKFSKGVYSLKVYKQTGSAIVEAASWSSTTFDVDDGQGRGKMTANGGTPFSTLAAGDFIGATVSTAGSLHGGIYKLEAATSTVLNLTSILPGEDSVASTNLSIFKIDTANVYRIAEGDITYSKDPARIPFARD